jgi:RNA polymerase sigma factor (sigma-70 family)
MSVDSNPQGRAFADGEGGLSDADLRDLDASVRRYVAVLLGDRQDIDDVAQETMTRVLTAQRRLDTSSVTGYAIVVARNLVRDQQRAAARHRRHERDVYDDPTPRRPDEAVLDAEEHRALRAALAELSPAHRDVLLAHDVEGRPLGDLAGPGGTAALAARLSRTRAALRVDYLTARRRDPLPTLRCRPVLLALSSGDRRRQDILRAGSHLLTCPACAELSPALVQRRRVLAAVVPWFAAGWWARPGRSLSRVRTVGVGTAGAAVAFAAVVVLHDSPPAPRAADLIGPRGALLPQRYELGRVEGGDVRAVAVPVLGVPADEGFWVGHGRARIWVAFRARGESAPHVRAGQHVSFHGTLVENPNGFAERMGVTPAEGAAELARQGFHISVRPSKLTIR